MMGLDVKFFGPQIERAITALEGISGSLSELAETAKRQREVLDKHYQLLSQPESVVNNSLHLVENSGGKGQRGRA